MNKSVSIAIHGGAGTIPRNSLSAEREMEFLQALNNAVEKGYNILACGGTALDAVTASVVDLEDCPLFNAGRGSVFTHTGSHEMDASIMNGKNLAAGAVAGIRQVKNPVLLAKAVMEKSEHVFLYGAGAEELARKENLSFESIEYFFDSFRHKQWLDLKDSEKTQMDHVISERKFGTVGAVACDKSGNLAAATSTGGMTNKRYNRIGDTPIIGAGTYANNRTCAVSATGHGEYFIRAVVAYDISCLMEYKGMSLHEACEKVVNDKLLKIGGEGGVIAVDYKGNIQFAFNSDGMYRAFKKDNEKTVSLIYR